MANAPVFAVTPNTQISEISAANTNLDGTTGTYVTIFTAGANGSKIDKITVKAQGTTTDGNVRIFYSDGVNTDLIAELDVTAITQAAGTNTYEQEVTALEDLVLETGHTLVASTEKAETFTVLVQGSDI